MLIFLTCSLILRWGNVSNSNVTIKFAQVHYFLSQNVGGGQKISCPPLSKSWGACPPRPPINLVPGSSSYFSHDVSGYHRVCFEVVLRFWFASCGKIDTAFSAFLKFIKSVKSDMVRIITFKQQNFSQPDPVMIHQFSINLQSDLIPLAKTLNERRHSSFRGPTIRNNIPNDFKLVTYFRFSRLQKNYLIDHPHIL